MRNIRYILLVVASVIISFVSCTKEGPKGIDGADGTDGVDGSTNCILCHTEEVINVKQLEWKNSTHATGSTADRFGDGAFGDCADCHTAQGYRHIVETGLRNDIKPEFPIGANCYTCHNIHVTYTTEDWKIRKAEDVELLEGGAMANMGAANTCITCHQSKAIDPLDVESSTLYSVGIWFGPHHGPQGNMIMGTKGSGAFELAGSKSYSNGAHASKDCTYCHMVDGSEGMGGHTNTVSKRSFNGELDKVNYQACNECHNSGDYAIVDNEGAAHSLAYLQGKYRTDLNRLGDALVLKGYMTKEDENEYKLVIGDYLPKDAAILYNYKFIEEDKSIGFHNPNYIAALIQNSIENLD